MAGGDAGDDAADVGRDDQHRRLVVAGEVTCARRELVGEARQRPRVTRVLLAEQRLGARVEDERAEAAVHAEVRAGDPPRQPLPHQLGELVGVLDGAGARREDLRI